MCSKVYFSIFLMFQISVFLFFCVVLSFFLEGICCFCCVFLGGGSCLGFFGVFFFVLFF